MIAPDKADADRAPPRVGPLGMVVVLLIVGAFVLCFDALLRRLGLGGESPEPAAAGAER